MSQLNSEIDSTTYTCNNCIMGVITMGLLTGDSPKGWEGCDSNYCNNREEKPQAV
jgi:hypothetical protein